MNPNTRVKNKNRAFSFDIIIRKVVEREGFAPAKPLFRNWPTFLTFAGLVG
jgi:hypothetical protein